MNGRRRWLAMLAALFLLAACSPQRSVRVEPADAPRPRKPPAGLYEVVRGDTLYGIAFRHGLDYRDLAALNRIGPPYTIYPGQRLRLRGSAAAAVQAARPAARPTAKLPLRAADPAPSPTPATTPATIPAAPVVAARPSPPLAPVADPESATPSLPSAAPRWQWPVTGQIIGRFVAGDPTRQGLNVAGSGGDPVRAAAEGVVVYSGSGLIGYGELIIVKHNDTWLSAYGHNRKRLVAEGDSVRGGQQIAELGRSGASRDMLHFEVRRNGKPVDPLSVLPKR
jgi:lipoprotein NlpD